MANSKNSYPDLINQEKQLNEFVSLFDGGIDYVQKNNEVIRNYVNEKYKKINTILYSLAKEYDPNRYNLQFLSTFFRLVTKQPLLLVDAINKYPNNLDINVMVHERYKYIFYVANQLKTSKIEQSFRFAIKTITYILADEPEIAKNYLRKMFNTIELIFQEYGYFNEIINYNTIHFDFLKSPIFVEYFPLIITYKEKYIAQFDDFNFSEINKIEKKLNFKQKEISKKGNEENPKSEIDAGLLELKELVKYNRNYANWNKLQTALDTCKENIKNENFKKNQFAALFSIIYHLENEGIKIFRDDSNFKKVKSLLDIIFNTYSGTYKENKLSKAKDKLIFKYRWINLL